MDKNADITGKHELTYGRGYVYSLQYHLVWCTKYRHKRFLIDKIAGEIESSLKTSAEDLVSEESSRRG